MDLNEKNVVRWIKSRPWISKAPNDFIWEYCVHLIQTYTVMTLWLLLMTILSMFENVVWRKSFFNKKWYIYYHHSNISNNKDYKIILIRIIRLSLMEFFIQNVFQTNGSENKMMQDFRSNKEMIWISFWRLYILTSAKKKNSKRWMVLENNYTNRDKLLPDNSDTDTLNTRRCFYLHETFR